MDSLKEKCGIFGVYSTGLDAARLVHAGLWALQHRGQEGSGISVSDKRSIKTHKGTGLVARVYDEEKLNFLKGYVAIGHNRYSTSGGSTAEHHQPVIQEHGLLALVHNGNLPSTKKLEEFLQNKHIDITGYNDSELMHEALRYYLLNGSSLEEAIKACYPLFTGAFSLLIMTPNKIAAVRDSCGLRPLSIGKLNGDIVFSSETCALDTIDAAFVRDVMPGEMVVADEKGMHAYQLSPGQQKLDIFEFIYFARPDSILLEKSVNEVRRNLGRNLAHEHKLKADVVIPVPDSAIPAAIGYAQASGIPFDHGFIKNRYIHRTFIRPAQRLRESDVHMKLNPLPQVIKGKDVVIVDDSVVRGTTSKKIVEIVRNAGAKKVHLVISSPPVTFPDFYGIDTPSQKDLIAANLSITEIKDYIEADSVNYLSLELTVQATGLSQENFSVSCFTGEYPISIGDRMREIHYKSV